MTERKTFTINFWGKKITIECGTLATLATSSVLVKYGDSTVLSVVTFNEEPTALDFFPLTVVFQEKMYSVGRIPGGFFKREGKPTEASTLAARLIDRALRPLFPEGFNHEVQVINNVLSVDPDADVRIAALLGSSLALCISVIPFTTPVAGIIIGKLLEQLIVNPTSEQNETSALELIVAGTKDNINMVEAKGKEILEDEILAALSLAHEEIKKLTAFQEDIIKKIGQKKIVFVKEAVDSELVNEITNHYEKAIKNALTITQRLEQKKALKDIYKSITENYENQNDVAVLKSIKNIYHSLVKKNVRDLILNKGTRLDGRNYMEIRPLSSLIDILPIVHGSAIFKRGETQVLSVVTLGAIGEHQIIDGLTDEEDKRFMHHYNFPAFSVGEVGRFMAPNRREIGHGALAEKALLQVLPTVEEFPYTIRVVSEVLTSNGSTSQAAICASSLAMLASGIPLKTNVAGIAMGLIKEGSKYVILNDIQGSEDHFGDMDFKVAGTSQGICALQMDIKISGITIDILKEALLQAKTGRLHILANMEKTIAVARKHVSATAPKIKQLQIPVDRIRDVIGTGGKIINNIIESADNVKIDINDHGQVIIYHKNQEAIEIATKLIKDIIEPFAIGTVVTGVVVRIEKFGYFVNLKAGIDGLLHNSQILKNHESLKLKQKVMVKIINIDEKNRIKLDLVTSA